MLSNQFWDGFLLGAFLVLGITLLTTVIVKRRAARTL
jgi:hypothetical protein